MKRFLGRFALFMAGLLLINFLVAAAIVWPEYYRPYLKEFGNSQTLHNTILLADSHGAAIPDPYLAAVDIANYAGPSDNYENMLVKLRILVEENATIERVILTADGHSVAPYRETKENTARVLLLADYGEIEPIGTISFGEFFRTKFLDPYLPIFSPQYAKFTRRFLSEKARRVIRGPQRKAIPWPEKSAEARISEARGRIGTHYGNGSSAVLIERLNDIVFFSREHDLQLVGLVFPLSPEYLSLAEKRNYDLNEVSDIFRAAGIPVLDFAYLFDDDTTKFRDSNHLNEAGAALFVDEIDAALDTLVVAKSGE